MPYVSSRRDHGFVLPPYVDDWVAPDHPVRFVWSFVESLNLDELGVEAKPSTLGAPKFPPRELLACWIYGFIVGVPSSRKLERACRELLPMIWLMGLMQPDHVTLWRSYDKHRSMMRNLFDQTVTLAIDREMVDFVIQAIDGSKVAVASNVRLLKKDTVKKLLSQVSDELAAMEAEEERAHHDDDADPPNRRAFAKKLDQKRRLLKAQNRIAEQAEFAQRQDDDGSCDRSGVQAHENPFGMASSLQHAMSLTPLVCTTYSRPVYSMHRRPVCTTHDRLGVYHPSPPGVYHP